MLSVEEARTLILSHFTRVESTHIPIGEAYGRLLAGDVAAGTDLPPFDNSAVDGFAVLSGDLIQTPVSLPVVADIPAGAEAEVTLHRGQAARIMTGAPVPSGANAVVMVEDTDFNVRVSGAAAPKQVTIFRQMNMGDNIRRRGMDVRQGEVVLHDGQGLRPQDIGLLAMLGVAQVPVYRKPRVAILSSGDELIEAGEDLRPGKVRDANSSVLAALALTYGAEVFSLGVAADRLDAVKSLLDNALSLNVDMIVSSAGVSVGAFDFVKEVLESEGKLEFWKVNMRPGKPLAFGEYHGVPFFGLPGNPVSAYIGFLVFAAPALEKLSGANGRHRVIRRVKLIERLDSDGRESYLRAVVSQEGEQLVARLTGQQLSSNIYSLVQANALLIIPSGVKSVPPGSEVEAWMI